jgi:hypothetical protein
VLLHDHLLRPAETALRKVQGVQAAERGLASDEPIELAGVSVAPKAVLLKLLKTLPEAKEKPISKRFRDVATEVRGTKNR